MLNKLFRSTILSAAKRPIETVFCSILIVVMTFYYVYNSVYDGEIFVYPETTASTKSTLLQVKHSISDNHKIEFVEVNEQIYNSDILLKHIFISSTKNKLQNDGPGILDKSVLSSSLRYLNYLQLFAISNESQGTNYKNICLKSDVVSQNFLLNGCLTYTIFSIWNNSLVSLKSDNNILDTINEEYTKNRDIIKTLKNPIFDTTGKIVAASGLIFPFIFHVSNTFEMKLIENWEIQAKNTQFGFLTPHLQSVSSMSNYSSIGKLYKGIMHFLLKFRDLIAQASFFEVMIVFTGYVMMYLTFIVLGVNMKLNGSRITMSLVAIVQGCFAFVLALFMMKLLSKKVDFIMFTEGIPFVVSTISFQKPCTLFSYIFKNFKIGREYRDDIPEHVYKGYSKVAKKIALEYVFEITVFLVGAFSQSRFLNDFCLLTAFILMFDAMLLFVLYPAFLALKLHVVQYRILKRRQNSEISESNLDIPGNYKNIAYHALSGDSKNLKSTSIVHHIKLLAIIGVLIIQLRSFAMNSSLTVNENTLKNLSEHNSIAKLLVSIGALNKGTIFRIKSPMIVVDRRLPMFEFMQSLYHNHKENIFFYLLLTISFCVNAYLVQKTLFKNASATKNKRSKAQCVYSEKAKLPNININRHTEDEEITELIKLGKLPIYSLEKTLKDSIKAIRIRRKYLSRSRKINISSMIPYENYDYSKVYGQCCENVIGYIPIPLGIAGPLLINGESYMIPLSTTEGCLVASISRGCKAISESNGATSIITNEGMSRGPIIKFEKISECYNCKKWIDNEGYSIIEKAFNSTTRFGKLSHIKATIAGNLLFVRFVATTGDAMGMNMISKGVELALSCISQVFSSAHIISVSGNYCTDKKPAAINWIEGRGKSVVAEAIVKSEIVKNILKTTTTDLVELNISKNLIGSAMAGSIGGFNAHAANIVTAMFLACGQDPAQNIESSNCITLMEKVGDDDLHITCTMPSIEVGTIGGGTQLPAQSGCLEMLNCMGASLSEPGSNSRRLASIVASVVMAGELSLCSALASGQLVKSHMVHNRKQ